MGIRSEPFEGVVLTGDDIQKFEAQIKNHKPNKAAIATVQRGAKLAATYRRNGQVVIQARKTK